MTISVSLCDSIRSIAHLFYYLGDFTMKVNEYRIGARSANEK